MGVYKEYKSHRDPKKFLEKFSKNISPDISPPKSADVPPVKTEEIPEKIKKEEKKYEVPLSKAAMNYKNLNNKCQEFLLGIISEENFKTILKSEREKLKKIITGFDNFGFKAKGISIEREIKIKNLFLKSLKEYSNGLRYFEEYLVTKQKKSVNSGIQLIISGGEKLFFIKQLSEKDKKEIIEDIKNYEEHEKEKKDIIPSVKENSEKETRETNEAKSLQLTDIAVQSEEYYKLNGKKIDSQHENSLGKMEIPLTHTSPPTAVEEKKLEIVMVPSVCLSADDFEERKIDINLLSSHPIFLELTNSDIEEIITCIKPCSYLKDHMLYQEGTEPENIYIVSSGEIVLYKWMTLNKEKPVILFHVMKGDILGDMGVIDGGPQSTNAQIISEKAELLSISREDFQSLLRTYPQLSLNLNKIYCLRMRDAMQKLIDKG
ncbi:MAG TPA: cyclic nucleotide-binding domain-containing protein [Candidatus Eremiobacteraeota bacterium]|nr:MAG: cAMP receptor protein [bacterium ADurb.Bin363]HPZ06639.1 cyclic nucleotide-binding domain-containing protein [Candidatus Eremiobacteraeota bacterium]